MWLQQKNKTHVEFVVTSMSVKSTGISGVYVSKMRDILSNHL